MKCVLRSGSTLFNSGELPAVCEPDSALQNNNKPAPDFVLCRDAGGNSTAVYGDGVWDFNPYRLSASRISRIRFDSLISENDKESQELIDEAKYILYCLIYFGGGGRLGPLSVATLGQYWLVLRNIVKFCYAQRLKPLVGKLSIKQLLTVPIYLAAFIRQCIHDSTRSVLSGMLRQLSHVGEGRLGHTVLNPRHFNLKRKETKQHPVIPTRIYLNFINVAGDLVDQIYEGVGAYELFVAAFNDANYGLTIPRQKSLGLGGKRNYRPDMKQAIEAHGLRDVLVKEFACEFKGGIHTVLLKMQYLVKTVIHIYTGMREQEVLRIPYSCLSRQDVRDSVSDEQNVVRDQSQSVSVLSTTTKFAGFKKNVAWFAPADVVKAVEVAQSICRGLAKLYKIDLDDRCPLFLNPSIIKYGRKIDDISVSPYKSGRNQLKSLQSLTIKSEDLIELAQSDPSRDFYSEQEFALGKPWPLVSHQLRRSLAFYGSSSGFVSLPALRAQFKHMTIQMARYYANNFDRLRTIFGFFDEIKKEFVLPNDHFALEFQMAMPMSVANQLIADLLFTEEPLFGGTGSHMEKQKRRVEAGELNIEDARIDTEQRVKSGEISYHSTLLGGCTKVGRCDAFLLGDYTKCLSCEGAIIKRDKLDIAIEDATEELSLYPKNSGEYQIVKSDIEQLSAFKARLVDVVRI
ncbi:hypothetical protein ACVK1X_004374 [Pseudomonas sp. PvR086]